MQTYDVHDDTYSAKYAVSNHLRCILKSAGVWRSSVFFRGISKTADANNGIQRRNTQNGRAANSDGNLPALQEL